MNHALLFDISLLDVLLMYILSMTSGVHVSHVSVCWVGGNDLCALQTSDLNLISCHLENSLQYSNSEVRLRNSNRISQVSSLYPVRSPQYVGPCLHLLSENTLATFEQASRREDCMHLDAYTSLIGRWNKLGHC